MEPREPGWPEMRGGFESAPLVVIWEVTRACDLACVHCRGPLRDRPPPTFVT